MGLYDSLFMQCPGCHAQNGLEFQGGGDSLREFTPVDVPNALLMSMDGDRAKCRECGVEFVLGARVVTAVLQRVDRPVVYGVNEEEW